LLSLNGDVKGFEILEVGLKKMEKIKKNGD